MDLLVISVFLIVINSHFNYAEILRLSCGKAFGKLSNVTVNKRLPREDYIAEYSPTVADYCEAICISNQICKSISFNCKKGLCQLFDKDTNETGVQLIDAEGWHHMKTNDDELEVKCFYKEKCMSFYTLLESADICSPLAKNIIKITC